MNCQIDEDAIKRVLIALIAEELAKYRGASVGAFETAEWSDDTVLDENGLGFDSLGLLTISGRVNQFFHMHEVGVEDYLLAHRTIGKWVEIVRQSLGLKFERLSFQTSGSTGDPKICTHATNWLLKDAQAISEMLPGGGRIVSLVPPHHIFGFIYTILMPQIMGRECIDARTISPGRLKAVLQKGDVIIATPHLWRYLSTSMGKLPDDLHGVTSTAPMPFELRKQLVEGNGLNLIEIYGSSETGGIGFRRNEKEEFKLFDWWKQSGHASTLTRSHDDGASELVQMMDRLQFSSESNFLPVGRHDNAIQIGGINVFPKDIAQRIASLESVAECAVRPFCYNGAIDQQRLKAFIVPLQGQEQTSVESAVSNFINQELKTHEQPTSITFGDNLPRNDMGKLADWT